MNPLTGKRVLVTRPKAQAAVLVDRLVELGAVPVLFPTIEIAPMKDTTSIDRAITNLRTYHWVIFTSVNGVTAFWQRLSALGIVEGEMADVHVAAIGPATAQALVERGVQPAFVPEEFVAEAILSGLGIVRGQRILLPRAEIARKALVEGLTQMGALVEEIAVYRTIPAKVDAQALAELEQGVDIATFTSSSTVQNIIDLLGNRGRDLLKGALIACIGPVTAGTARRLGLEVDILAETYTIEGLLEALIRHPIRQETRDTH